MQQVTKVIVVVEYKVQYLPPKCGGVEYKVQDYENEYLKTLLKYSA